MANRKDISFQTNPEKFSIAKSKRHAGRKPDGRVHILYAHHCLDCGSVRWFNEKRIKALRCQPCGEAFRKANPKRAPYTCQRCKKRFRAIWRKKHSPMFCSVACHNKAQTEKGIASAAKIICKHCKKLFLVKPCQAKRVKVECCSNACKVAHHKWLECPQCRKRFNARHNKDRIYCSRSCALKSWKETRIERVVRLTLESAQLSAEREYKVPGIHCFDFYVPSLNLLIEADGDYWHSRPWSKERDERKTNNALSRGFRVERFREHLIMSDKWLVTFENAIRKYNPNFELPRQQSLLSLCDVNPETTTGIKTRTRNIRHGL